MGEIKPSDEAKKSIETIRQEIEEPTPNMGEVFKASRQAYDQLGQLAPQNANFQKAFDAFNQAMQEFQTDPEKAKEDMDTALNELKETPPKE